MLVHIYKHRFWSNRKGLYNHGRTLCGLEGTIRNVGKRDDSLKLPDEFPTILGITAVSGANCIKCVELEITEFEKQMSKAKIKLEGLKIANNHCGGEKVSSGS